MQDRDYQITATWTPYTIDEHGKPKKGEPKDRGVKHATSAEKARRVLNEIIDEHVPEGWITPNSVDLKRPLGADQTRPWGELEWKITERTPDTEEVNIGKSQYQALPVVVPRHP